MKIKGVLIPVEGPVSLVELEGLDDFQSVVGGFIEAVRLTDAAVGFINEEGKILSLEYNQRATSLSHEFIAIFPSDVINGPMVVVGEVDKDGDQTDLPQEWINRLMKINKAPA